MPSKSHKTASLQARLRQRRKRFSKGPSGIPTTPTPQRGQKTATVPGAQKAVREDVTRRQPYSRQGPGASAYNFVGPELRRIGLLAGAMTIILIVIAVVLR